MPTRATEMSSRPHKYTNIYKALYVCFCLFLIFMAFFTI